MTTSLDYCASCLVPTWTVADMQAAIRQGWSVFLIGETDTSDDEATIEKPNYPEGWAEYTGVPQSEIPRLRTHAAAVRTARQAVARGEVHAIKAWMHLLTHSPRWATSRKLSTWKLPGEGEP
jgi:hypothetical protein